MNNIFTTTGSKSVLTNLIKNHSDRKLYLYQGHQDFQLVDPDSNNSIFTLPIKHQVIKKYGDINWNYDKNVVSFSINDDERKLLLNDIEQNSNLVSRAPLGLLLLQSNNDPNKITITTFWQSIDKCHNWYNSSKTNFITKYKDNIGSNYYTIDYERVR